MLIFCKNRAILNLQNIKGGFTMKTVGDLIAFLKGLYELILDFFNKFIKKDEEETTAQA